MSNADAEALEATLANGDAALDIGGKVYTITKDMVQIVRQQKKEHGKDAGVVTFIMCLSCICSILITYSLRIHGAFVVYLLRINNGCVTSSLVIRFFHHVSIPVHSHFSSLGVLMYFQNASSCRTSLSRRLVWAASSTRCWNTASTAARATNSARSAQGIAAIVLILALYK